MEVLFLLVLYLLIFITQLFYLVSAIRKNKRNNWLGLFIFGIGTCLFSSGLYIYFSRVQNSSIISDIGGEFISILLILLSFIMLFVTSCAKIMTFEFGLKKQNQNYVNPVCLILATCFIFLGVFNFECELLHNINLEKTKGTVVAVESGKHFGQSVESLTISYEVNDEEYQDVLISRGEKEGDIIDVYYNKYDTSYELSRKISQMIIYIPSLVIGILIIIFRVKSGFYKEEKAKQKKEAKK